MAVTCVDKLPVKVNSCATCVRATTLLLRSTYFSDIVHPCIYIMRFIYIKDTIYFIRLAVQRLLTCIPWIYTYPLHDSRRSRSPTKSRGEVPEIPSWTLARRKFSQCPRNPIPPPTLSLLSTSSCQFLASKENLVRARVHRRAYGRPAI